MLSIFNNGENFVSNQDEIALTTNQIPSWSVAFLFVSRLLYVNISLAAPIHSQLFPIFIFRVNLLTLRGD